MTKLHWIRSAATVIAVLILLLSPSQAEFPELDPIFEKPRNLKSAGKMDEALEALEEIRVLHPGTELDSYARLMEAAYINESGDLYKVLEILESIVEDFPATRVSLLARRNLIDSTYLDDGHLDRWLPEANRVLSDFGAPSLDDVAAGRGIALTPVPNLTLEEQQSLLVSILLPMADVLSSEDRKLEAVNVLTYFAYRYPGLLDEVGLSHAIAGAIQSIVDPGNTGIGPQNEDLTPPVLTLEHPADGSVVNSPAQILITAQDGSFTMSQVAPSTARLEIDGLLRDEVHVCSAARNRRWELDYSLTVALSPGAHNGRFTVADYSGNQAELTFSFTVSNSPPGEDLVLSTTRDSIIRAQKPHRNEGANPLLMLSHRPEIRNKSNNPLVGFDLANVDLNGLTSAKLIMNIQECDIPKRWGKKGRFIITQPVSQPWVEGNGKQLKVKGKKTRGDGQGVTWFSPIDEDISNKRPNGSLQWMGARPFLGPVTALPVKVVNKQTGPIEFDVTADVQTGFQDGWMLRKQDESKFGNIRFYSKEGAAEAGNPDLAPRLILEYGGQSADTGLSKGLIASSGKHYLRAITRNSERPSFKEVLQDNAVAAYAGQVALTSMVSRSPITRTVVQTAYRSWLNDSLTLANLSQATT